MPLVVCGDSGSARALPTRTPEETLMAPYWVLLLFVVYFVLLRWVLPRFGVPT
jgi:hypothetical protein